MILTILAATIEEYIEQFKILIFFSRNSRDIN